MEPEEQGRLRAAIEAACALYPPLPELADANEVMRQAEQRAPLIRASAQQVCAEFGLTVLGHETAVWGAIKQWHTVDDAMEWIADITEREARRRRAASPHDRVVTPATDPDRFTDEEAALYAAGKCGWQTGYGLPWTEHCGVTSKPGASFGNCDEHNAELLVDYWPDGTSRSDGNPRWQEEPGYATRVQAALEAHQQACMGDDGCPCREEEKGAEWPGEHRMYVVGDTKDVPVGDQVPVIGDFDTEEEAAAFISTLPEHLTGRYDLTGPPE